MYSLLSHCFVVNRGARITEFIADKQLRLRSYIRRRPIPFKRMAEMDAACGTKSLLLQFCPDFDECLYNGDEVLVERFLSDDGLKVVNVEDMMSKCEFLSHVNTFTVEHPASANKHVFKFQNLAIHKELFAFLHFFKALRTCFRHGGVRSAPSGSGGGSHGPEDAASAASPTFPEDRDKDSR